MERGAVGGGVHGIRCKAKKKLIYNKHGPIYCTVFLSEFYALLSYVNRTVFDYVFQSACPHLFWQQSSAQSASLKPIWSKISTYGTFGRHSISSQRTTKSISLLGSIEVFRDTMAVKKQTQVDWLIGCEPVCGISKCCSKISRGLGQKFTLVCGSIFQNKIMQKAH